MVLVAEDSTAWGADLFGKPSLPRLLRRLEGIEGVDWLRLLYCHPAKVKNELGEMLGAGGSLLPYLDLPVQAANDKLLRSMRRMRTKRRIKRNCSTWT